MVAMCFLFPSSYAGLTRVSMLSVDARRLSASSQSTHVSMDCRVKPGNDDQELIAQRRKLDRSFEQSPDELQHLRSAGGGPAAVGGVEQKLVLDVGAGQWLLRAAAHIGLALLDHSAVAQGGADVAGEIFRIGILRIDLVAHLAGERDDGGIAHGGIGKIA